MVSGLFIVMLALVLFALIGTAFQRSFRSRREQAGGGDGGDAYYAVGGGSSGFDCGSGGSGGDCGGGGDGGGG